MAQEKVFTSGLSVSAFVLAADDGVHTLGIVQGGSVFHVGLLQALVYESQELTALTRADQQVRRLALSRLEQEAARLGAHGVIGVSFQQRAIDKDGLEFWAMGTAIRLTQGETPPRPFLCTLSGAEFWTLRRAGYRPCGVALGVCAAYHVVSLPLRNLLISRARRDLGRKGLAGMELPEYTEAVQQARQTALHRLADGAAQGLAEGVINIRVEQSVAPPPTDDDNPYRRFDLLIRFVALGTAVAAHRDRWPLIDYAVPLS